MAPMNNQFMDVPGDARIAALPQHVHRQPDGRLPARLRRRSPAVERLRRRAAAPGEMYFVQDDWKVNARLSLNLGLRYDFMTPALEATNARPTSIPRAVAASLFATDGSLADRTLVNPDRNNFAPRVGRRLQARRQDARPRRLGHLLQPVRPRRQRRSARAESAGPDEQDDHEDLGLARVLPTAGLPGEFLNAPNLDPAAGQLQGGPPARRRPERSPTTTINQASLGSSASSP